jgi:CDP-diacylglycerol--glycerol-3-phosphate 3-phosphatidyltransferase
MHPLSKLPNQITLVRLLLVPVLWVLAFKHMSMAFALALVAAALTDTLDGFLARKLKQTSSFGAWFDSFADNLLLASSPFWLWMLLKQFILSHLLVFITVFTLFALSLIVGFIKYKKMVAYHLLSSKITAVIVYVFVIHALLFTPNTLLFYISAAISSLSYIEEIAMTVKHKKLQENKLSVFQ